MKFIQKILLLSLVSSFSYAAQNPIESRVANPFPSTVLPTSNYLTTVYFTNTMPFPMVQPFTVEKVASPANEFSFDDFCTGKRLGYLEQCPVDIHLSPRSAGSKRVQLIEAYGNDRVPLTPLVTRQESNSNTGADITGAVTTALPSTLDINTPAPFKFTFTNNGNALATGLILQVTGAEYNTDCTDRLAASTPCTVQGTFTPQSSGIHAIQATLSYTQGNPAIVSTSTTTSGQAGGLVCSHAVPLASQTLINSSHPVTLLCTNNSGADITIDSHVTNYPTGGADGTFTPDQSGGDNCTAQTLHNNASCQLKGTYDAPAAAVNDVLIALLVNYHTDQTPGLSASTSTGTQVVTQITNARTINLVNQCNFKVWWSMVGGAVANPASCNTSADCPSGSTCNTSAKICYFNNYGPAEGSYELAANGGTAKANIIETDASTADNDILWKGLISASTNCSNGSCANNSCQNNGGLTSCPAGVGFEQPATVAEFTLKLAAAQAVDSYDISNVNGFSMPIAMATSRAANNYECGTAGNNQAAQDLKACNFSNVTPPTNMYYWVSDGGACTRQNTCSNSSQICGLAFDTVQNTFAKKCGDFLGYWAANQICQTDPSFASPFGDNFSCNLSLTTPFPDNTYTLTQLLKCSPPNSAAPLFNSCYLNYTGYSSTELQQCCGCTNWTGIATPSANCPSGQVDPQWTHKVEPIIRWMKEACPTSYAYPYDDKASSFQCEASEITEYTITFCPGGDTGLPTGKTDGRQTA